MAFSDQHMRMQSTIEYGMWASYTSSPARFFGVSTHTECLGSQADEVGDCTSLLET